MDGHRLRQLLPALLLFSGSSLYAAEPVKIPWNTNKQEFGASISDKGNLFFYSNRGGKGTDLYVSRRVKGVFQPPQALAPLNSPFDDQSPFVFPDESAILFSSNRDGSREFPTPKGIAVSRDLYISRKIPTGWTKPELLPGSINTAMIEENPFVHNEKLYFVRYPFGQPDLAKIFVAEPTNDSWTNARELFPFHAITPGVYGDRFYFGRKYDKNKYQIVWIPLAEINSPAAEKKIQIEEKLDTPADEAAFTASTDGNVIVFCRRSEKGDYDLYELRKDPWDDQENFSVSNIFFHVDESTILPESDPVLDRLAKYLVKRKARVSVTGHTDKSGRGDANMKLSHDRAQSVKRALVARGIPEDRIITQGKGSSEPVDPADTEEAYAKNRRTEFRILKEK